MEFFFDSLPPFVVDSWGLEENQAPSSKIDNRIYGLYYRLFSRNSKKTRRARAPRFLCLLRQSVRHGAHLEIAINLFYSYKFIYFIQCGNREFLVLINLCAILLPLPDSSADVRLCDIKSATQYIAEHSRTRQKLTRQRSVLQM